MSKKNKKTEIPSEEGWCATIPEKSVPDAPNMRRDLQYCYDRLSHLLFIFRYPDSVQAGFGPGETMTALLADLPDIQARYGLESFYVADEAQQQKTHQPHKSKATTGPYSPEELRTALDESLQLQRHYAILLNNWDGGHRLSFASVGEWMARLRKTGTLPVKPKKSKP